MSNMLPCPFCGHQPYDDLDTWRIMGGRTGHRWAVACSHCEVSGPGADSALEAKRNWQHRTPAPTQEKPRECAECGDALDEFADTQRGMCHRCLCAQDRLAEIAPPEKPDVS